MEKNREVISKSLFNAEEFNISSIEYQGSLIIIQEKLKQIKQLNEKLLVGINLSKDPIFKRASSNFFYILKTLNVFLIDKEISNINILNISLEGLQLHQCDLSGSHFQNVMIDGCNFNFCNLQNVSWNNTIYNLPKNIQVKYEKIKLIEFLNDQYLAINFKGGQISIWNVKSSSLVMQFNCQLAIVKVMKFSHQGKLLALCDESSITIWKGEFEIYHEPIQIGLLKYSCSTLYFSQNDSTLVSIPLKFGSIRVWSVEEMIKNYRPQQKVIEIHTEATAQSFFLEGVYLLVGLKNGQINVYIVTKKLKLLFELKKHSKMIFAFSTSDCEKMFASRSKDQTIIVRNYMNNGQIVDLFTIPQYIVGLSKIIFASNQLYAISEDNFIYKVNMKQNQQVTKFEANNQQNFQFNYFIIQVNQQGNLIAVANRNSNIIIYDVSIIIDENSKFFEIENKSKELISIEFSYSKYLALLYNDKVEIWDCEKLKLEHEIEMPKNLKKQKIVNLKEQHFLVMTLIFFNIILLQILIIFLITIYFKQFKFW